MRMVFEVHVAPGADPSHLLSAEVLRDAKVRVMTIAEARQAGFEGLPDPPAGKEVRIIAAVGRDASWVRHALETSEAVSSFRAHEVM